MTAEIVNLRQVRKTKARALKHAESTANRAKFGRTKEERARTQAEGERTKRALDAHHRDGDDPT